MASAEFSAHALKTEFASLANILRMGRPISTSAAKTNRVREWRTRLGLTLEQIAERTGMAISTIQRAENGKRGITIDSLYAIARAMNLDLPQIVAWTTAPPPPEADELVEIARRITPEERTQLLKIARTFRSNSSAEQAA